MSGRRAGRRARVLAFAVLALATACAGRIEPRPGLVDADGVDLVERPGVYTLANLHPDEARSVLYAVNFQQRGLVPLCSEVRLLSIQTGELVFRVLATGRTYTYRTHRSLEEPFESHLLRFFGTRCPREAVEGLGAVDRDGIERGVALRGMTREGVLFALGPPPGHETPSLDATEWIYRQSRFDRLVVVFGADGLVAEIRD